MPGPMAGRSTGWAFSNWCDRARGLGIVMDAMVASGNLILQQVDAAELSPGEFSERVRHCVHAKGATAVVIDSLNGFQSAMPEENSLILHMHELLQFLNRQGATTFLTVAQHGLVGDMRSPVGSATAHRSIRGRPPCEKARSITASLPS